MSAYPTNPVHEAQLASGAKVFLPEWNGLRPPAHTSDSRSTHYDPRTGERPQFYDATVEWMRNDWPLTGDGRQQLTAENAFVGGTGVRLFHFPLTNTWHASDALDVDHKTPWRQHLVALGVDNRADAAMAYNDASNLRVIPSFYNRARDSGDAVLSAHGAHSPEWKAWVDTRMGFDPKAAPPPFDPDGDLARRTKATTGQVWTGEHTRSDLGFDKQMLNKWFDHALHQAYAGDAQVRNPVTGGTDHVPLFRCAASQQLTTRDALDIDHDIPFEIISEKMRERFPHHVITKADMLDLYNDTSNLRLVTRGVNSSHEYERGHDGQWRDKETPKQPGEFLDFKEKGPPLEDRVRQLIKEHYSGREEALPKPASDEVTRIMFPRSHGAPDNLTPPLQALALAQGAPVALTQPDNPYGGTSVKMARAVDSIAEHDPHFFKQMKYFLNGETPTPGHVDKIATSLIAAAKEANMGRIDGIAPSQNRQSLFAIEGDGHGSVIRQVDVPLRAALQFTVEENSQRVARVDAHTLQHAMHAQAQQPVAEQPDGQHTGGKHL